LVVNRARWDRNIKVLAGNFIIVLTIKNDSIAIIFSIFVFKSEFMEKGQPHPLWRVFQILSNEKREITAIYFYAILYGLVQLSLPLGIQSIIGFVLGGAISTSMVILILAVVLGVLAYGLLQVNQKKIIEKLQQQLFVRYTFRYAYTIPKLNLKQVDGYYLPEMVNRLFDSVSLQKGISKLLLDVPAATIQIVFGLILLSFYHSSFIFFGLFNIKIMDYLINIL
jgi:ABC-type bacteriocin/lantibiotic exporter with double-glycine peptidase domain